MWEVFTTKPNFDREELQYLGEVPTPWPAFVFVSKASDDTVSSDVRAVGEDAAGRGLSAEKAALIRDHLFPALHEGIELFINEGKDSGRLGRILIDVDIFGHL
jgi:hypothetical protein